MTLTGHQPTLGLMEYKRQFAVSIQGVGVVVIMAWNKFHAKETAFILHHAKQPDEDKYKIIKY